MSESAKKRKGVSHSQTKETREKISKSLTGRKLSKTTRDKMSQSNKGKRAVQCIETEEIFESIKKAAEWAGVSKFAIQDTLRGKTKKSGGYHWKYFDDNLN